MFHLMQGRFALNRRTRRISRTKIGVKKHTALYPDKTIIIVAGYPKSGNTWCCRILAQALDCPSAGYLGNLNLNREQMYVELATEGLDRTGRPDLVVLKSHHTFEVLQAIASPRIKLVSIVRDPRDLCVSGIHHFYDGKPDDCVKMLNKMRDDTDFGNWGRYVSEFTDHGVPFIRYEDLRRNAKSEVERIFSTLEIGFDPAIVDKAVHDQSFEVAKKRYKQKGEKTKLKHARNGKIGEHATALPKAIIDAINQEMAEPMHRLGYGPPPELVANAL